MSSVIIRDKKASEHPLGFLLSDESRRRAREYLKEAGIEVERLQPLIWPKDAVSAFREHMYAPWEFKYKSDILREKQERMEGHLWWKREYGIVQRKPLYVWVFWCPGINDCFFKGYWTYFVGLGKDYHGGGYKDDIVGKLLEQVIKLFPLVETDLFGNFNYDLWQRRFIEKYQRGIWCGKPQGKAPVWAEVKGGNVEKILSRAEWPERFRRRELYPAI